MILSNVKKILKPILLPLFQKVEKAYIRHKSFDIEISKLLRGGENGIRAAKYAELTNNFLRPSTSVMEGPHVKLLQLYAEIGEKIFEDKVFVTTDYYKNAYECMKLTGAYFYDRPEQIKTLAERFIRQYKGEKLDLPKQPGQSDANQPIWVRPIKYSSCFEVIDGNHRIAHAIMRGDKTISAMIYEKEPAFTPLQQLLLDCLWINKQKWLYQPVESPELKDQWHLVRRSTDRLEMMESFLKQQKILPVTAKKKSTYLDIGSSYGWFVRKVSDLGLKSFGMERDPFGMDIGFKVYGLKQEQIIHSEISLGLSQEVSNKKKYDIVSCLSVLHHFVLHKNSVSAEELIKLLDQVTGKILFLDTGEEHEEAFAGTLKGWNPEYIQQWIKKHTSFKEVIILGKDQDRLKPFETYYGRTLFACIK